MVRWVAILAVAVLMSVGGALPTAVAEPLPTAAAEPTAPDGEPALEASQPSDQFEQPESSEPSDRSERFEPPGRPDDPPRRPAPPERPSTVLDTPHAATSLDRSLAAGRQAAPSGNRIVGSVIAAGGSDVVNDAVLATVASVTDRSTSRRGGADRYDTAVALSMQEFIPGTTEVWLATGENFPDGLTASSVAGARRGPVLLTRPDALPPSVGAELARLSPSVVWVVGGEAVVSATVIQSVQDAVPGVTVSRLAGDDRYGTASAVAGEFFDSAESVFVATGRDFPDALAAGPAAAGAGAPTLLVTATTVPASTESELRRMRPAAVYVVGGPAVVSDAVMNRIRTITGAEVVRVAGADRYATAAAVADRFFEPTTSDVILATGLNFPDALGAGAVAGTHESPLLLVNGSEAPPRVTLDAARRVSWWLPDSGMALRYIVITHPDDEFAAWSLVGDRDPRRYDVLITLTTGESTSYCTGRPVQNAWSSQQYLPQPQPTGLQFSDRCKKHRIDSWNVFVEGSEDGRPSPSERLSGGPIQFAGREIPVPLARDATGAVVPADSFDLAVGADHAVVSFDMGALTSDEVLWAVQTVRGLVDRFPTDVEGDIIGAGFFNDAASGYHNVHADHEAVYRLLGGVDLDLPGSQYTTVGHAQSARVFGASVAGYCGMMCHPGAPSPFLGSMGRFQYAYGWLAGGYWPPGQVDAYAGFSSYQSFAKWF